ncbi:hypothetical protein OG521_16560 [Streptomyces sp. NBC_01463]|uniref:hypothetical protein n=1 Tax=Streptomyces sp. NPDC050392 TaxID=3155782 RepID=UPI003244B8DD
MGVSVTDGVLHSSSCWTNGDGSNGAVIQYGIPYITRLRTDLRLTAAGTTVRIDDVNRDPGRSRGCAPTSPATTARRSAWNSTT